MEQRVRVHRTRADGNEVRVVRADPAPAGLALRDDGHWLSMYADREGAACLATLWALAARSARSLVHLPIRANPAPGDDASDGGVVPVALDLVLVHHSLQFPTASWKEVRARLGAGAPHTVTLPEDDLPDRDAVDHERSHHRTYRDRLGFDIAAHTLFVVGSATAFRAEGAVLRDFVERAPSAGERGPDAGHFCVELAAGGWRWGRTRGQVPGTLHIEYREDR